MIDLGERAAEFLQNPYPLYRQLRGKGPVHEIRFPDGQEAWLVVGHAECLAAFLDPRLSRDWVGHGDVGTIINTEASDPGLAHMLMADPPRHTRLRGLVAREFTHRRVQALAGRVTTVAHELLDAMLAREERRADLIDAFAFPLPMIVICELLGIPQLDRQAFRGWSNELVSRTSPEAEARAYQEVNAYLADLVEQKREGPGEDLLSALLRTADGGGDQLSARELIGTCLLLLLAGHETTVNLIGNGMRALFAHPGQLAALRADLDGLLPGAIEEVLRYDGPVECSTPRLALEPTEIGDVVIPQGATVLICIADASRDGCFPDADRFDITRQARGHMAFGYGLHHCLGAPLARLEGRIAVRALLERCPKLALDPEPEPPIWIPGLLIRGVRHLQLIW